MATFATSRSLGRGLQLRVPETRNAFKLFTKSSSSCLQGRGLHQQPLTMPMQSSITPTAGYSSKLAAREFSTPSISETVKSIIEEHKVVVFSKTFCPYCSATKTLLEQSGVDAKVIELDEMKDGDEMQGELHKLSGQRTVPNVFINGKHLGGNDDTQVAARSGKLEEMLK